MFGRSKSSQLKLAEEAFANGRLDEALDRVSGRDLKDDGRARRLLSELCEPLLRRAQDHLIAERFSDALADIERAARCGVLREKVEDWRQRIVAAIQDRQRDRRGEQAAVAAVQQHMNEGQLTLARGQLDGIEDTGRAGELEQRVGKQAEQAEHALEEANAALARGDFAAAARGVMAARRFHAGADEIDATESAVCKAALSAARESLVAGRLDRVGELLGQLEELGRRNTTRSDLETAVELARQAAAAFRASNFHQAEIVLTRLAQVAGDVGWIETAREQLRVLTAQAAAVAAGPLGFVSAGVSPAGARKVQIAFDDTASMRPLPGPPPVVVPSLDTRLVLRIDGIGSFLLLRGDRTVIGRAGPGATADLPLISDLPENAAQILRTGEDYFLLAGTEATVDGHHVRQALLSHGDRVGLGRRVRWTFLKPSRKSSAAVIELGTGVRAVADVRRVILFGGPVLIGQSGECHIPVPGVNLVLSERGGQLAVRQVSVDRGGVGASVALLPGQLTEIAGIRLAIQLHSAVSAPGRVIG